MMREVSTELEWGFGSGMAAEWEGDDETLSIEGEELEGSGAKVSRTVILLEL